MTLNFGWPQLIWVCFVVALVIHAICHHGERATKTYDGVITFISCVLSGLLLYWGGFFG